MQVHSGTAGIQQVSGQCPNMPAPNKSGHRLWNGMEWLPLPQTSFCSEEREARAHHLPGRGEVLEGEEGVLALSSSLFLLCLLFPSLSPSLSLSLLSCPAPTKEGTLTLTYGSLTLKFLKVFILKERACSHICACAEKMRPLEYLPSANASET